MQFTKRTISKLLALGALTLSLFSSSSDVSAATTYNMSDPHTYKDLYASIIFSNGKGTTVDQVQLSYDQISRYQGTQKGERYGAIQIGDPIDPQSVELTRYLATIQKYHWLETRAKDEWYSDWGTKAGDAIGRGSSAFMLNGATFGANLFDVGSNLLDWLEESVLKLDVPSLFGLRSRYTSDNELLGGDAVPDEYRQDEGNQGFIGNMLATVMEASGIDYKLLTVIRQISYVLMIGGFIISILLSVSRLAYNRVGRVVQRFALRVFTMIGAVTLTGFIQPIIKGVEDALTLQGTAPTQYSTMFILDSLGWAATKNLDFATNGVASPANSTRRTALSSDIGKPYSELKPTVSNIHRISEEVENVKEAVGLSVASGANKEKSGGKNYLDSKKATELIGSYTGQVRASVNDYYSMLSNINRLDSDANMIAASYGIKRDDTVIAGANYTSDEYGDDVNTESGVKVLRAYFLVDQGDLKKIDPDESTKMQKWIKAENGGEPLSGDDAKEIQYSYVSLQNMKLPFSNKTAFRFIPLQWNQVESYVYGSSLSNSTSTANYHNFVNGVNSSQIVNVSDNTTEFSNITTDTASEKKWKRAMWGNGLIIAAANRYNGATSGTALSTQSVAFILQSSLSDSGIKYQGYNTVFTEEDKGKPNNAAGATFFRYTIPHSSGSDLSYKQTMLSLTWIIAGTATILVFFYILKAPIFAITWRMIANFCSAFIFGDIISLVMYLVYYSALAFSFAFARIGMMFATTFGTTLMLKFPAWLMNLAAVGNNTEPTNFISGATNAMSAIFNDGDPAAGWGNGLSLANITLALGFGYIMAWPMFDLRLGRRGNVIRTGILGAIVMLPYILAEAIDEWMDQWRRILYGKSKHNTFAKKLSNQFTVLDQKQVIRDRVSAMTDIAGSVANVVPGGQGVSMGLKMASSVIKGKAGEVGQHLLASGMGVEETDETGTGALQRGAKLIDDVTGQYTTDVLRHDIDEFSNIAEKYNYTEEELRDLRENNPELYNDLVQEYRESDLGYIPTVSTVDVEDPNETVAVEDVNDLPSQESDSETTNENKEETNVVNEGDEFNESNESNEFNEFNETSYTEEAIRDRTNAAFDDKLDLELFDFSDFPEVSTNDVNVPDTTRASVEDVVALKQENPDITAAEVRAELGEIPNVNVEEVLAKVDAHPNATTEDIVAMVDTPHVVAEDVLATVSDNPEVLVDDLVARVKENPELTADDVVAELMETPRVEVEEILAQVKENPNVTAEDIKASLTHEPTVDVDDIYAKVQEDPTVTAENVVAELMETPRVEVEEILAQVKENPNVTAEDIKASLSHEPTVNVEDVLATVKENPTVTANDIVADLAKAPTVEVEEILATVKENPSITVDELKASVTKEPTVNVEDILATVKENPTVTANDIVADLAKEPTVVVEEIVASVKDNPNVTVSDIKAELAESPKVQAANVLATWETSPQVQAEDVVATLKDHPNLKVSDVVATLEKNPHVKVDDVMAELERHPKVKVDDIQAEVTQSPNVKMSDILVKADEPSKVRVSDPTPEKISVRQPQTTESVRRVTTHEKVEKAQQADSPMDVRAMLRQAAGLTKPAEVNERVETNNQVTERIHQRDTLRDSVERNDTVRENNVQATHDTHSQVTRENNVQATHDRQSQVTNTHDTHSQVTRENNVRATHDSQTHSTETIRENQTRVETKTSPTAGKVAGVDGIRSAILADSVRQTANLKAVHDQLQRVERAAGSQTTSRPQKVEKVTLKPEQVSAKNVENVTTKDVERVRETQTTNETIRERAVASSTGRQSVEPVAVQANISLDQFKHAVRNPMAKAKDAFDPSKNAELGQALKQSHKLKQLNAKGQILAGKRDKKADELKTATQVVRKNEEMVTITEKRVETSKQDFKKVTGVAFDSPKAKEFVGKPEYQRVITSEKSVEKAKAVRDANKEKQQVIAVDLKQANQQLSKLFATQANALNHIRSYNAGNGKPTTKQKAMKTAKDVTTGQMKATGLVGGHFATTLADDLLGTKLNKKFRDKVRPKDKDGKSSEENVSAKQAFNPEQQNEELMSTMRDMMDAMRENTDQVAMLNDEMFDR